MMMEKVKIEGVNFLVNVQSEQRDRELANVYTYHSPKGDQQERYVAIRDEARQLATLIDLACPHSRERALAQTKLEEAVMWANASIARNE